MPAPRIAVFAAVLLAAMLLIVLFLVSPLFDQLLSAAQEPQTDPVLTIEPGKPSSSIQPTEEAGAIPTEAPASGQCLVAKPLSECAYKPDGPAMQDLLRYGESILSFGSVDENNGLCCRNFSGSAGGYAVVEAYTELLCSQFDFALAGQPYYQSYGSSTYFDFVLSYTGSGALNKAAVTGTFSGNTGDVMIYGSIVNDRVKGSIFYNQDITPYHAGFLYQLKQTDQSYVGLSASAGLYRMADGSYETSDGRLSASPGEAVVLSDGTEQRYQARYVLDLDSYQHQILVESGSGSTLLEFYFPASETLDICRVFPEDYFIIESDYAQNKNFQKQDGLPLYSWSSMFAILHNGGYVIPIRGMSGEMKRLNVRVMYWEDGSEAVFHACAQFDTAPYEMELLIAVPLGAGSAAEPQPVSTQDPAG